MRVGEIGRHPVKSLQGERLDAGGRPSTVPRTSFRDSHAAVVSLVSTGTLGDWDRRPFRANILLDGSGENELVGARVTVGGAVLKVQKRLGRCVMVSREQPGRIPKDLGVLRTVHREHDLHDRDRGDRGGRRGCVARG